MGAQRILDVLVQQRRDMRNDNTHHDDDDDYDNGSC
jgi:hypothetical protein